MRHCGPFDRHSPATVTSERRITTRPIPTHPTRTFHHSRATYRGVTPLAVGAMLGVATRIGLDAVIVQSGTAVTYGGIIAANIVGTLTLFGLTAWRSSHSSSVPESSVATEKRWWDPRSTRGWLLWATGYCGSLTTYSALVLTIAQLSGTPLRPLSWNGEWPVFLPFLLSLAALLLAGAMGAVSRWALSEWITLRALEGANRWSGQRAASSQAVAKISGICVVNVLGSGAAGAFFGLCQRAVINGWDQDFVAALWVIGGAGFLGAFTTFSTAILDVWNLWRTGHRLVAGLVFTGVGLCAWGVCVVGWHIAMLPVCGAM